MARNLLPQALGESDRCIEHGAGQNEKEFLATIAPDTVDFARLGLQELRELLEHGVAGLVAVVVVYALELVDVAHDERDRLVEAHGMLPHLVQALVQGAPVLDLRETISERDLLQLFIQLRQFFLPRLESGLQRLDPEERIYPG